MVKRKSLMYAVMYAVGKKELILRHSIVIQFNSVYLAFCHRTLGSIENNGNTSANRLRLAAIISTYKESW